MSCSKNILEIPFSPSAPADTDVVIFTLADGTSVIRYWGTLKESLLLGRLEDLNVTVDDDGPVGGTSVFNLPVAWTGKRIRVFRNGLKFTDWSRTGGGIQLTTVGDVWMGTDENGAGFEEKISVENY